VPLRRLGAVSRLRRALPLAAVLLLAALLRVWALGFGLPLILRPDDQLWPGFGLAMWRDLNHHYHHYPGFLFWVNMIALGAANSLGLLLGWWSDWAGFESHVHAHLGQFVLLGRAVDALFSWGAVWATYGLARTLLPRTPSLIAAALMAVAPLAVRESHGIAVDVPLALFATLCLTASLRLMETGARRHAWRAALFAGLAGATKWPGVVFWAVPVAGFALHRVRSSEQPHDRTTARSHDVGRLAVLLLIPPLILLVLTPWILTAPSEVWRDVSHQLAHAGGGHRGVVLRPAIWRHLTFSIPLGIGLPPALLVLAGIATAGRDLRRWLVVAFAALYLLAIGTGGLAFARYVGPVLPALCVLAVCGVWSVSRKLAVRWALISVALVWPLVASLEFDALLTREDTRTLAQRWILANVPRGTVVLSSNFFLGGVPLPTSAAVEDGYRVFGVFDLDRNVPVAEQERRRLGTAPPGAIAVINTHPLVPAYDADPALVARLRPHLETLARFTPFGSGSVRARFDLQDAFFVPLGLFWGVSRPGPEIEIAQLTEAVDLSP
jgi:hypothetical protein